MSGLFYPISKLAWVVLAPSHVLLWLVLTTAALLLAGRARPGRWLAALTALYFIAIGVLPVGVWLARPLENEYPPPSPAPASVTGIVTLGGGMETRLVLARGAPASAGSLPRLLTTYALARRYPAARVVFSGGWGAFPDATAAKLALDQMGLDPARLTLEDRSRNTYENLVFSRALVRPQPGDTWVLATSALQMPRAMAVARRIGWPMVPWPTDYVTSPGGGLSEAVDDINVAGALALTDHAAHEWIGLLAYRLQGMGGARPAAHAQ